MNQTNYLNELAEEIYKNAVSKGFYDNGKATNTGERLALIHSEVSEALEADRKNLHCELTDLELSAMLYIKDDESFKFAFKEQVKDSHADEIADIIIRALDHARFKNINIAAHVALKMRYNSLRPHMHGKKY